MPKERIVPAQDAQFGRDGCMHEGTAHCWHQKQSDEICCFSCMVFQREMENYEEVIGQMFLPCSSARASAAP